MKTQTQMSAHDEFTGSEHIKKERHKTFIYIYIAKKCFLKIKVEHQEISGSQE